MMKIPYCNKTFIQHNHDDTVQYLHTHLLRETCKRNTCLTSKPEDVICLWDSHQRQHKIIESCEQLLDSKLLFYEYNQTLIFCFDFVLQYCNAFTRFISLSMALTILKMSNFAALSDVLFGVTGHVLAFSDFSAYVI